eukprot:366953-Alexandrium_andersonii.AAC.1
MKMPGRIKRLWVRRRAWVRRARACVAADRSSRSAARLARPLRKAPSRALLRQRALLRLHRLRPLRGA